MKITPKSIYLAIGIILFASLVVLWRNGSLNEYLPFFMTTDGWNKYEREINKTVNNESATISVIYRSGQESLFVDFDNARDTVTFTHPKTGTTTLPSAVSASGARYANSDETIVFWEHQGEGSLFINNEQVFKGTIETSTPLREAYADCVWEKVEGAGLELWGQSCDFGDTKLEVNASETLPGMFLEDISSGSPVAIQQLIQVFNLPNQKIEDVLPELAKFKDWSNSDSCAFTQTDTSRKDVTRYTLMPTGAALKQYEATAKNEPINSTCAGFGMGNSGIQYFEIYASNPNKALFINVGQEAPLFDENTIVVK